MTTAKQPRARKGGEVGINGEYYNGGAFICTTPLKKMTKTSKIEAANKTRKQNYEPYKWASAPEGKTRAIFPIVGTGAEYIDRYAPEKGIRPYENCFTNGVMFNGTTYEEVAELCRLYNSGERWI